jgi:hypothetical protein
MKSSILLLILVVLSSALVMGCGEAKQSDNEAKTQQKGKSPDGKDTNFSAQTPQN